MTGLHSKKRPNDLIFTRMFDGRVLDMVEVGVEEIRGMSEFEVSRWSLSQNHGRQSDSESWGGRQEGGPSSLLESGVEQVGYGK